MKYRYIFLTIACSCYWAISFSQHNSLPVNERSPDYRELRIGDTLPGTNLKLFSGHSSYEMKIGGMNDKTIILDFFETWCSSCIKELPRLNELQKMFEDSLQILVVASQPKEVVQSLLSKLKIQADRLAFYYADSVLKKQFPHRLVPHEVWIGKNGEVLAITSSSEVTASNISTLLNTGRIELPLKKDILDFDPKQSLIENLITQNQEAFQNYQSVLSGRLEGAGGVSSVSGKDGEYRLLFINTTLYNLYGTALGLSVTNRNRLIWKSNKIKSGQSKTKSQSYCYEIRSFTPMSVAEMKMVMLSDLNRQFGLQVKKEGTGESRYFVIGDQ